MIITVTSATREGIDRTNNINLNHIVNISQCDGKKADEGFRSTLFTGNGHCFYSRMEPADLVLAYQGFIATEEEVQSQIDQMKAMQEQQAQQEQGGDDPEFSEMLEQLPEDTQH